VYPALAVLRALQSEAADVLWVGGLGGMEADLVKRAGVPFTAIPAAGVHGVGLRALPANTWQLARGYFAARRVLRSFQPHALLFTGGYIAVPMALARRKTPSVLYVPDIEPGLALKLLSRFADRIAVTAEDSRSFLPGRDSRIVVTGYPTRPDLQRWDPPAARRALGLDESRPVLLVFGGSRGARSINRALLNALPALLQRCQIVHVSGQLDWPEIEQARKSLPEGLSHSYHPYPYLHEEMGAALTVADLAVSRAGASTLGELPLFGLPAVLVPYPYAWRYQQVNAAYLARHGAAIVLEDARLGDRLSPAVLDLLDHPERLSAMRTAMRSLARPQAAQHIARLVLELAGGGAQENRPA